MSARAITPFRGVSGSGLPAASGRGGLSQDPGSKPCEGRPLQPVRRIDEIVAALALQCLVDENRAFTAAARDRLLLVPGGGENCIRLLPLLNLSHAEADIALERMDETCNAMLSEKAA